MERVNSSNQLDCACEKKETRNNLTNLWRHFRSFSAPTPKQKTIEGKKRAKKISGPLQFAMEFLSFSLFGTFFPSFLWADQLCGDISIVNSSSSLRLSCENAKIERGRQRRPFWLGSPPRRTQTPQLDSVPKKCINYPQWRHCSSSQLKVNSIFLPSVIKCAWMVPGFSEMILNSMEPGPVATVWIPLYSLYNHSKLQQCKVCLALFSSFQSHSVALMISITRRNSWYFVWNSTNRGVMESLLERLDGWLMTSDRYCSSPSISFRPSNG